MKGRRYAINGDQNIAASTASLLGLTATAAVEPGVYFFALGCQDTPADIAVEWYWQRYTAAGTATAVTPQNLGPGTTASTSTAGKNHTVEPTYTANAILFRLALNQRAAHSIVLDPDGALYAPAVANNGMGLYPTHASATPNCDASAHFQE